MKCDRCEMLEDVRAVLTWAKGGWQEIPVHLCKLCRKKCVCKYIK